MVAGKLPKGGGSLKRYTIMPRSREQALVRSGLAKIRGDTIKYLVVNYEDNFSDDEEKVRADLYLDLVKRMGYSSESAIQFEKYHKIGHPHIPLMLSSLTIFNIQNQLGHKPPRC